MKIMQLNVWMNKLDKAICDIIKSEDPEIICMQESLSCDAELGSLTSFQEINNRLKYPYSYFSPVYAFRFMHEKPQFGNLIFSKLPIKASSTIFTNGEYNDDFDYPSNPNVYNVRNFQHVELIVGDKILNVINHHGYHIHSHKLGDEHTLKATHDIVEYTKTLKGPTIITGDFNLSPESDSIKTLEHASYRNLSVEFKLETTRNRLTKKSEVCDYIFINDEVDLKSFYMPSEIASDHNALVATFEV